MQGQKNVGQERPAERRKCHRLSCCVAKGVVPKKAVLEAVPSYRQGSSCM